MILQDTKIPWYHLMHSWALRSSIISDTLKCSQLYFWREVSQSVAIIQSFFNRSCWSRVAVGYRSWSETTTLCMCRDHKICLLRFQAVVNTRSSRHLWTSDTNRSGSLTWTDSSACSESRLHGSSSTSSTTSEGRCLNLLDGLAAPPTLLAIDLPPFVRTPPVAVPTVVALAFEQQHSALMNSRRKLSFSQPYSSGLKQAEPSTSRWQIGYAMPPTYTDTRYRNDTQLSTTYATTVYRIKVVVTKKYPEYL